MRVETAVIKLSNITYNPTRPEWTARGSMEAYGSGHKQRQLKPSLKSKNLNIPDAKKVLLHFSLATA